MRAAVSASSYSTVPSPDLAPIYSFLCLPSFNLLSPLLSWFLSLSLGTCHFLYLFFKFCLPVPNSEYPFFCVFSLFFPTILLLPSSIYGEHYSSMRWGLWERGLLPPREVSSLRKGGHRQVKCQEHSLTINKYQEQYSSTVFLLSASSSLTCFYFSSG